MIVQPLDALKERLRESRLFSEEKLQAVCSGPKWEAAQDIPQGLRALVGSKALTAWQAQMLYAGKTTLRFGNYILLDRLSQDPQNRTFLAEHDSMGRKVALRQLSRQNTQNEKVSKAFLNKVRAFAGVNHPRIVHLFDVAQDHDRFYVVKELIEGENLAAAVAEQGTSNQARACRWIAEIAEGIQALHDNGIAHLDLHPGTILVQKDNSIKILEPGTYESGRETAHAAYLAPEGQGEQGSPAADLYSLGMLAHFVLTGQQRGPSPAPLFETEIATLTGKDPAARAAAATRLREAALPLAELSAAAGGAYAASDIVEAEEIVEAEPYDAVDPLDAPFAPMDAAFDPLAAPFDPLGASPAEGGDFFANLDAAAALATTSQPLAQPTPGTAAAAAAGFGAPGGFPNIATGGDRVGAASAMRPSKSAAKKDEDAEPAEPAERKKTSVGMLIALAAGGGALAVLLLIGVATAIAMFAFSDTTEVARSAGPDVTQTKAGSGPVAADPLDADAAVDGAGAVASGAAAAKVEEPIEEEEEGFTLEFPLGEEPAPAAAANPAAASAPPAEMPAPAAPAPAVTEVAAAPTAPADPATPPADPAAPAPATTPAPEPTPPATTPVTTPAAPAANAAAAAPANPPAKAPAKEGDLKNPFREVPDSVDLPVGIGEGAVLAPQTLAQVHLNPGDVFQIELEGGDIALKGNQKFTIEPARGGLAQNEWEIRLTGSSALKDDNEIAHLQLEQTALQFRWTDRAAREPNSAYLKNCALVLRTGTAVKIVDLRSPLAMEPEMIAEMEPVRIQIPISEVSDPDSLTLKILGLSVPFDYHILNESLKADKDSTTIRFGRDGDVPAFLKVDVSAKKNSVQVVLTPYLLFSNSPQPQLLKPQTVDQLGQALTLEVQQRTAANANIEKYAANYNSQNAEFKKAFKQQFDTLNAQKPLNTTAIEAANKMIAQLTKVKPAVDQFAQGATFHYRLTAGTGEDAPVLAFTPPAKKEQVTAPTDEKKK